MSQHAAELCTLLIEDNFGELFARIFSTLQRYHRLPLLRLKFYSRLSDRQLHHGLAAMIRMLLVFHYTSIDDGVTYYEANTQAAYYLVRTGKVLDIIEERLGGYAATVMSAIMFLGHAQTSLLQTLPELMSRPETNGANGSLKGGDQPQSGRQFMEYGDGSEPLEHSSQLHPTLKVLAAHGYIVRVREAHFQALADNVMYAERVAKSRPDMKMLKGRKLEEALQHETERLLKERLDGDLTHRLMFNGLPRGIKRRHANGVIGKSNKRLRLDSHVCYEGEEDEVEDSGWLGDDLDDDTLPMEPDLVVRVNYEKLDVVLRNHRLVEISERSTSPVTARVYECLLRRIEYQTPRCRDQLEVPREGEEEEQYAVAIPLHALAEDVDPQLDLTGTIGPSDPSQPLSRRGKRPLENGAYGESDGPDNTLGGRNRVYEIDQHLALLAEPPYVLSTRRVNSGIVTWTVEYRHVIRELRHLELERLIQARFGSVALRITRVLLTKGRLDEKRLQEITLLPPKDLRQVLASLQASGFVDLQEVPRDTQRQPSRTIYLWYYDPDHVRRNVLRDTYKAMSRCLQRLKFERERVKECLDKAERSDVKGHEEQYLSKLDLETLRRWRAREDILLGEVARLDDLVAVLRDF